MSDITFLSPSTISLLTPECLALLSSLHIEIIDEDLRQKVSGGTTYFARWRNWKSEPKPKIRKIAPTGVETILYDTVDYTTDLAAGEITLGAVTTDIVRADYFYGPLNDTLIERLMSQSVKEVSVLIARDINPLSIPTDYHAAVCKRLFTNVLKNLMIEARDYFAVSVAGRSISKEQVPAHFDLTIKQNETQLQQELNYLRYFNKTARLE